MTTDARTDRATDPVERAGRLMRIAIVVLFLAGLAVCLWAVEPVGVVMYLAYAGVGGLVAYRRPSHPVGWLLILAGWGATGISRVDLPVDALVAGGLTPQQELAAWLNGNAWTLVIGALFGVTLVFPSGTLPGGRARTLALLASAAMVLAGVLVTIAPTINVTSMSGQPVDIPNPVAVAPEAAIWGVLTPTTVLYPAMFMLLAAGIVSLLLRARRSTGLERLQYTWLLAAICLVVIGSAVWVILTFFVARYELVWIPVLLTYPTVPIAIAVAVLRYRLFEIDRIISRTIGWAIVTLGLATVFVAVVVGLQTVLTPWTSGDTLAVAASTLLVFGLFQPLRRRVQRAVDRRFDRARVDAEATVEALAARLREDVALDAVRREVLLATDQALRPTATGMWLRGSGGST